MRVVVTGGCGFVGTNLIRWLLATTDDVHVTNYDALTYAGNLDSLRDVADDPRYRFVRGDIRDITALTDAMRGHDAVVNLAAETHVDRSIEDGTVFVDTNVAGAATVFEVARRLGVERVLHASTDEVYGPVAAPHRAAETDVLAPSSTYAASKASADLVANAYRVTYGVPVTVTRATNSYGPYQFPEKVLPLFVTNLIEGQRLPVYGDGSHVREWLHVRDNAAAQWRVLTHGTPGETYNIGSRDERTNLQLARAVLMRFGAGDDMLEHVADRPGHDRRYALDSARVRDLGWVPEVGFDDGLDATVAWYRDNGWWWRPLRARGAAQRRGLAGPLGGA